MAILAPEGDIKMTTIKTVMLLAVLAYFAAAQQVSVLAPREIDKARAKVEQTWTAWQGTRPEANLLGKSAKQALAEIDRSAAQADAYLDAKAQFYVRLSEAFHQQTAALRQEDDGNVAAANSLKPAERQRLETLLEREKATRQRIDELEKQSDRSTRQELELESLARQEKDLARLQDEIRKRMDTLDQLGKDQSKARESRNALIDRLEQIVTILDSRAEDIDLEKTQWRNYHQQLRDLVTEKGGKP
jgi:hypothetical protein